MTTHKERIGSGRTEIRDGMVVEWDVPITMDDGLVLRADVFRPVEEGRYPALLSYGPYAKGLHFEEGYPDQWRIMCEAHPDVPAGSSNLYANWEVVDPEKWVPVGYACVRVDSRGTGRSPGFIRHFSPRETQDFYDCIEWAGVQPWSNGKVGLSGISYYAMNQWQVASMQPPHLAAMCAWEGAADWYRDATHHGGILSTFWGTWYENQVTGVQYGLGTNGPRSRVTGELVCGDETLTPAELEQNRADFGAEVRDHPLIDDYYRERLPEWSKITTPLLSSGNWGGFGLHQRGNTEGYVRSASAQKWLEMHGLEHWTHYYTDYGRELQQRFFDHFLKGEDNGWENEPRALLNIRRVDGSFSVRAEEDWPIPRTEWTPFYLGAASGSLGREPWASEQQVSYRALHDDATFWLEFDEETELTGPSSLKLFLSSSTADADVFVILRLFDSAANEMTFQGSHDPQTSLAHGWLRASHRELDPELSTPYRPVHTHERVQPLSPGEVYELDVEIWPTCIVIPAGFRLALTIQGRDFQVTDEPREVGWFTMTGVGPFKHDDPSDRPAAVFDNEVTLHTGGRHGAHLLLPIVPKGAAGAR
ncbi:MAG TPA: CocE/NonD family hydrolase [Gaiellaceae bacterium]|nr:CocE/NonD family hydrolase [Gaiellaceae bacterium]